MTDFASATPRHRAAWFVIALATLAFAEPVVARIAGHHTRWTAWALPLLIAANAGVFFLGMLDRWPRVRRVFPFVSIGVAVTAIVSETLAILHR